MCRFAVVHSAVTAQPAARRLQLPVKVRSAFGAFERGREKHILSALARRRFEEGEYTTPQLLGAYQNAVPDSERVSPATDAIKRLADGEASVDDLPYIIEVLYYTGHRDWLLEAGLLFPAYDVTANYSNNVGKPMVTTFEKPRPAVHGGKWHFLGQPIGFPIGVAACPLTDNAMTIRELHKNGFNVFTYRTVRSTAHPATPPPNWLPVDDAAVRDFKRTPNKPVVAGISSWVPPGSAEASSVNMFGLPSVDPEFWRADLANTLDTAADDQIILVSVLGSADNSDALVEDFVKVAKDVEEVGAEFIELNLSSPNTLNSAGAVREPICHTPELAARIVKAVRGELKIGTRLVVKLALTPQTDLERLVSMVGVDADAYSAINAVGVDVGLPGERSAEGLQSPFTPGRGGIAGTAIHELALQTIEFLVALRQKHGLHYELIGSGGVTSPASFKAMHVAGADVVQVATSSLHYLSSRPVEAPLSSICWQ